MQANHETDRTLGDIARYGTVASLDRAKARLTVKVGDALSGPIPWLTAAGAAEGAGLSIWSAPQVGDQVMLICPEGELAAAVALPGVYSTANPAPASDEAHSMHFGDGAIIRYDPTAHALAITLPEGGTFELTAPGGVTITADIDIIGDVAITGDLDVSGEINATGDVMGEGTSLATHKHSGVDSGSSNSGPPV